VNARRGAARLAFVVLAGCYASNVVAPEQRLVAADVAQLVWQPADASSLDGYFVSVDLQGEAAASLRCVYYVFVPGGRYTGAALADVDGELSFQTLRGTWQLGPDGLALDDTAPVRCEQAPGHLRLTAPNGVVVLRRERLP